MRVLEFDSVLNKIWLFSYSLHNRARVSNEGKLAFPALSRLFVSEMDDSSDLSQPFTSVWLLIVWRMRQHWTDFGVSCSPISPVMKVQFCVC